MLTLAALYAVSIAGMFFAQNRLLFPTMFAGAARVQLPASTWRLEVRTPDGKRLAGVRIPSQRATADGATTLLGFGGNAWNAEVMALTLHALFPHRDVMRGHFAYYGVGGNSRRLRWFANQVVRSRVPLPRLCAEHRQAERAGAFLGLPHNF
jgi:hypothetical protein